MAILQCGCNYPCRRYPSSSTESWPKRVPRRLRGERLSSDHGEISPLRERNDASVPPTGLGKNRGNKTRPDVPMLGGYVRTITFSTGVPMHDSKSREWERKDFLRLNALFSTWIGVCCLGRGVFEVMTSSRSRFFAKFIGGGLG